MKCIFEILLTVLCKYATIFWAVKFRIWVLEQKFSSLMKMLIVSNKTYFIKSSIIHRYFHRLFCSDDVFPWFLSKKNLELDFGGYRWNTVRRIWSWVPWFRYELFQIGQFIKSIGVLILKQSFISHEAAFRIQTEYIEIIKKFKMSDCCLAVVLESRPSRW